MSFHHNPFSAVNPDQSSSNPWGVEPEQPQETAAERSLKFRLNELERREKQLSDREAKLREREEKIEEITGRLPNWPRFRPILYHSIDEEIPSRGKAMVKHLYHLWLLVGWTYFINCIASFTCLVTGHPNGGAQFVLSVLILGLGVPVSWNFWYQQVYQGAKKDSSLCFFLFFFNFVCHLGAMAILGIGMPGWGGAGVILTIDQFQRNLVSGIFCIVATASFGFQFVVGLWQLKSVVAYYRASGMSAQKAQSEAARGIAKSDVAREAVLASANPLLASAGGGAANSTTTPGGSPGRRGEHA